MARTIAVAVTARPSGVVLKYLRPPVERWNAPHWIAPIPSRTIASRQSRRRAETAPCSVATANSRPAGFFVTEEQLGGNITDFVVLSPTKAYAIVQRKDLRNALVVFDPTNPAAVRTLFTREAFLPDIALAPDGMLWLADQSRPGYGIRIVDPAIDDFITAKPIDVGLPPFSIGFQP